ncbi:MAG TPA: DUF3179 domain-containing protein [Candidatus Nitrosotenuis sp.]|nr:DUF3179 domain-containing protein [Candidatus Nitrosotenuis sp.]
MNLKYAVAIVGGAAVVAWLVLTLYVDNQDAQDLATIESPAQAGPSNPVLVSSQSSVEIQTTNGIKHIVPLDEIKSGGPPKDGIPSIDSPKFVSASKAEFVSDDDIVIGLRLNGETKAYPLFILVWHEIVNDRFGDTPVAVTYCPLCFTTQVFERLVNDKETEFGTSGKLYNSNLVMYDRNTDSMWSQALGKAIVGKLTGLELKRIPFDLARWSDWKKLYPDTLVLSTDTGFSRPYGSDPYGDYYTDSRIIFPVKNIDDRMHPKEIIMGFASKNSYKAYKLSDIESQKIVNDVVGDQNLVLVSVAPFNVRAYDSLVDGQVLDFILEGQKMKDVQTSSEWNLDGLAVSGPLKGKQLNRLPLSPGFWFEWVAFHPETEV